MTATDRLLSGNKCEVTHGRIIVEANGKADDEGGRSHIPCPRSQTASAGKLYYV